MGNPDNEFSKTVATSRLNSPIKIANGNDNASLSSIRDKRVTLQSKKGQYTIACVNVGSWAYGP